MRKLRLVSCLEGTPVSLCPCTYLNCISKKSIHITTIETIDLLYYVEIIEESTFVYKIFFATYTRYAIEPKDDMLVYGQTYI